MKVCIKCGQPKPVQDYYGYSDGRLMTACGGCHRAYVNSRRKNPEVARILKLQSRIRHSRGAR